MEIKMKFGIEIDSTININIKNFIHVLHNITNNIEFIELTKRELNEHSSEEIDKEQEFERLKRLVKNNDILCAYFTRRPFYDSYFYHGVENVVVISMANWNHYTNLPIENGILFFIAQLLVDEISDQLNHDNITGCISDFLWHKTSIDRCMKMAHICNNCNEIIKPLIEQDAIKKGIYNDVINLLDGIANTSRWGNSIFLILKDETILSLNPSTFEDFVADYYRKLGAEVKQDINIAGFQIDVLIAEKTPSGEEVKSIVECKFYQGKVGNRIVNDFARIVATIVQSGEAERGILVSYAGFTKDAHLTAKHANIKLLQYKDIVANTNKIENDNHSAIETIKNIYFKRKDKLHEEKEGEEIFIIMPFASDYDDLFFYGIMGAVNAFKAVCKRADKIEYTGDIMQEVYKSIQDAKIIIAEVSDHNVNVFYELGYAHALKKPVILLTKDVSKTPFDISGYNHIIYNGIQDLENKLTGRIKALLNR